MSTASVRAHPNIALVKYWGKRQLEANLPAVPSLSLTLAGFSTETRVVWGAAQDQVSLGEAPAPEGFRRRALRFLDQIFPGRPPVEVFTRNNFPTGAGLASSASGFAALTAAASLASGLPEDREAWARWARRGSGSATRSVYGGFVLWPMGQAPDGSDCFGRPLAPPEHWDLRMVVAVVSEAAKAVGSTEGMTRAQATSPLWETWCAQAPGDVEAAARAVLRRDLPALGEVMEASTFKMFATMHTSRPPLFYWQPATLALLHRVQRLRAEGLGCWCTLDAGPQVKVLCSAEQASEVARALEDLAGRVHVLAPGPGIQVLEA